MRIPFRQLQQNAAGALRVDELHPAAAGAAGRLGAEHLVAALAQPRVVGADVVAAGPRFSRNFAIGESSDIGSSSSMFDSPQRIIATRTPSCGTSSTPETWSPIAS
jgi:hypothetical protein